VAERDDAALRGELAGRIMGFILSQAVYVAAKLGVADLLAAGPTPVEDLAAETDADEDALYRLLRLLAGYGIFTERDGCAFENTRLSELLREDGGFRDFALVFGELIFPAWSRTLHTVETGDPAFVEVFGARWEEHLAEHPEASALFNRFMAGRPGGKDSIAELLADDNWVGGETVVDVGGGNGALLIALLERRHDLEGVVFDLPYVAPEAEQRVRDAGLADRCRVVAGDFSEGVPEGADAYVLSHILHGLGDEDALELLRTIRRAGSPHARVLVVDGIVAPPNEPGMKMMDLLMLVLSAGRERTEAEWRLLFEDSGFELGRIRPYAFGSVLEAVPT
jgi:O-methyltransferase domain/Dimerisation domain